MRTTVLVVLTWLSVDPAAGQCIVDTTTYTGEATYYYATGEGSCLFDASPGNLMVAAMNDSDYNNSQVCGECVRVDGPDGSVTVRIVDRCPGCVSGDLDLSPQAFEIIADTNGGRVPISWRIIPCDVTGPIGYHFKDGSNQWWTAVQIRNHRYPIASVEVRTPAGIYLPIPRLWYNYFVDAAGLGPGPYDFRVTDVYGQVLSDVNIPHVENGTLSGSAQFPECSDPPTDAVDADADVPSGFRLWQNYPNPWNPATTIRYAIPVDAFVTITVYDPLGRAVRRLVQQRQTPGEYEVTLSADDLPSGVYLCRLAAGSRIETIKLALAR